MKLETDLKKIAQLAQEREEQNWRFRSRLKQSDLSCKELDAIVHRHYEDVASQIDCCTCGNCCRCMVPVLSPSDIARLATALSLPKTEFMTQFLVSTEEKNVYTFNKKSCPLLSGNRCTVYASRPDVCRSFPNLHKKDFVFRLIQVLINYSVCPIVFNVFERLKDELRLKIRYPITNI